MILFAFSFIQYGQTNTHRHTKYPKGTGKGRSYSEPEFRVLLLSRQWSPGVCAFLQVSNFLSVPTKWRWQQQWRQDVPMVTLGPPEMVTQDRATPGHQGTCPAEGAACTAPEASDLPHSLPLPLLSDILLGWSNVRCTLRIFLVKP